MIVTLVCALVATSCWAQETMSDSTRLPKESKNYGACIMRNGSIAGINENEPRHYRRLHHTVTI